MLFSNFLYNLVPILATFFFVKTSVTKQHGSPTFYMHYNCDFLHSAPSSFISFNVAHSVMYVCKYVQVTVHSEGYTLK